MTAKRARPPATGADLTAALPALLAAPDTMPGTTTDATRPAGVEAKANKGLESLEAEAGGPLTPPPAVENPHP